MEDACREKAPPSEGGLSGGPPATHGPGQKSLMVPIHAGEVLLVAGGRSDVPNQCTKTEGKNKWGVYAGLALEQQHAVHYTRCRPHNGTYASRWWTQVQGTSAPCFGGKGEVWESMNAAGGGWRGHDDSQGQRPPG